MILVIVGVLMVRLVRTAHQMSLTVVRLRTVVDKLTRETVGIAHRMKRIEEGMAVKPQMIGVLAGTVLLNDNQV